MSRSVALGLTALSLFLVILPLVAPKPGLPATLKSDEPAYFLAAASLAHDFDLIVDEGDLARLFESYPFLTTQNLILASQDGWQTLTFGKPFLYSLFAAPLVWLFGANGMVAFNMLLLVAMIWMGTDVLRRTSGDAVAALFATGFFLLSSAYAYVYWLHPEIFMMAGGMACLYFGLHVADAPWRNEARQTAGEARTPTTAAALPWWRRPLIALALSGTFLIFGAWHKPILVALGVPVGVLLLVRRRWRALAAWIGAGTVAGAAVLALSWGMTGEATAYLMKNRAGFHVETPHESPVDVEAMKPVEQETLEQRAAGWSWIFYLPKLHPRELAEDVGYFFVGRHTGLFLYMPWTMLALGLFAVYGSRSLVRWSVLASIVVIAAFFLLWISFNWHGGGGFVGNRYFVIAYPAFLFLVPKVRPAGVLAFWAIGGLLVGPLFAMPYGAVVPQPTLQVHARGTPYQPFPFELSLKEVPGHHGVVLWKVWFQGRKDQMRPIDDEVWVQGNDRTEMWLQTGSPHPDFVFDVRSQVPENRVTLRIGDAVETVVAGPEPIRVTLRPRGPDKVRTELSLGDNKVETTFYAYRMVVETDSGELPAWRGVEPPHRFYLGAALAFRGSSADVADALATGE